MSDIRELIPTALTMSRRSEDGQAASAGVSMSLPTTTGEHDSGHVAGSEPQALGSAPHISQSSSNPSIMQVMLMSGRPTSRECIDALEKIEDMIRNVWEPNRMRESDLLESYRESIPRSLVENAAPTVRRRLRDFLRDDGVPIRYGTGVQIHRALLELLPEETPPDPNHLVGKEDCPPDLGKEDCPPSRISCP